MSRASFSVQRHSAATRDRLFDLLADAPSWPRWAGPTVPTCAWEPGTPEGVGAVRVVGRPPLLVREQVVRSERPEVFSYTLLTGARLHHYRSTVRLTRERGGTRIDWSSELSTPVPGLASVLAVPLRRLVTSFATRLARYAERG